VLRSSELLTAYRHITIPHSSQVNNHGKIARHRKAVSVCIRPPDAPFSCLRESGLRYPNLRPLYAAGALRSGQVVSPPSRTRVECLSKLGQKGSFIASNSSLIACESFGQRQKGRFAGKKDPEMPGPNKGACSRFIASRDVVLETSFFDADALIH